MVVVDSILQSIFLGWVRWHELLFDDLLCHSFMSEGGNSEIVITFYRLHITSEEFLSFLNANVPACSRGFCRGGIRIISHLTRVTNSRMEFSCITRFDAFAQLSKIFPGSLCSSEFCRLKPMVCHFKIIRCVCIQRHISSVATFNSIR